MTEFRSNRMEVYIIEQCKVSLCAFDDKRVVCEDGISASAFGHYRNEEEDNSESDNQSDSELSFGKRLSSFDDENSYSDEPL